MVTAAVSLITCLCKKNPDDFKTCISLAVSRLSRVGEVSAWPWEVAPRVPVPWGTSQALSLCPAALHSVTSWLRGPGEVALPPWASVTLSVHADDASARSAWLPCRHLCEESEQGPLRGGPPGSGGCFPDLSVLPSLSVFLTPRSLPCPPLPSPSFPLLLPPPCTRVLGTCPRPPVCLAVCGLMRDTDESDPSPLGAPCPVGEGRVAAVSSKRL